MDLRAARRRAAPAVGLFFLAPFVAEFLLGEFALNGLPTLLVMAPMYGGGALVIREAVRRSGRGRPSILVFGLAYGMLEEGIVTHDAVVASAHTRGRRPVRARRCHDRPPGRPPTAS